jgi:hypothetical protein
MTKGIVSTSRTGIATSTGQIDCRPELVIEVVGAPARVGVGYWQPEKQPEHAQCLARSERDRSR